MDGLDDGVEDVADDVGEVVGEHARRHHDVRELGGGLLRDAERHGVPRRYPRGPGNGSTYVQLQFATGAILK